MDKIELKILSRDEKRQEVLHEELKEKIRTISYFIDSIKTNAFRFGIYIDDLIDESFGKTFTRQHHPDALYNTIVHWYLTNTLISSPNADDVEKFLDDIAEQLDNKGYSLYYDYTSALVKIGVK